MSSKIIQITRAFSTVLTLTFATWGSANAQTSAAPPNVLIIVADDIGYMDFGAYGGEASTPAIDAIAQRGAKMSRYYTSPQCGPSRAMLLTGADNHELGMAMIAETLPESARGNPAYSMRFPEGTLTLANHLGAAGYQSYAVGKWGIGDVGQNLPGKHGFDRSMVFDATGADNWVSRPYIPIYKTIEWFEDDRPIERPGDQYSSELFVDQMIEFISGGNPGEPFFGYLAFQAVHIPVQAPREFTDKYNGRFDAGWHALREERLARGKELGLIPQEVSLPPLPKTARDWESLEEDEKALLARAMQVNAGMIEAMDFHIGRLIDYLEEADQLDNTIIVIVSDNGPEPASVAGQNFLIDFWLQRTGYRTDIENLGERDSMSAIGIEWATAAAVPFSRFKFHSTEGGHRVPMIIAGPGIETKGFVAARTHVFDIVPTVLEFAGLPAQQGASDTVPIRGRSLAPILRGETSEVYGGEEAIGMEVAANAALYKGDWKLQKMPPPSGDGSWRLYNLAIDPGESQDLQAEYPEIFESLKNEYAAYAKEVGVIDLPADYSPYVLIQAYFLKPMLIFMLPYLLGVLAVIGAFLWFGLGRVRKGRQLS